MFTIKNKIKILSAVILVISSAATIFTACDTNQQEIPDETVIGTKGEILGVSYYTVENESETYTVLYKITTKNNREGKTEIPEKRKTATVVSVTEQTNSVVTQTDSKGNVVTEKSTRARPTFPQIAEEKTSRKASQFSDSTTKMGHIPIPFVPPTEKATQKPITTVKQTKPATSDSQSSVSSEKIQEISDGVNIVFKSNTVKKGDTASIMIQGTPGKKYSINFNVNSTTVADYSDLADQTADENGFVTWSFIIPSNCESGNKKIVIKENGSNNYAQTSINIR